MALQTELEEFVALALGVGDGEIGFGLTVGGTDDVSRLVNSAHELSLVAAGTGVWVDRVNARVIALLSVGLVCAVGAIESIKEGVEQVGGGDFNGLVELIIDLIQSDGLRVNQSKAKFVSRE